MSEDRTPQELLELQPEDYRVVAEYIWEEYERRKTKRADLDKAWDEIERQVKMEYTPPPIDKSSGRVKAATGWMPTVELPWQRQTLEILTTDLDRMIFPAVGDHFEVEARASDKVLEAIEENVERETGARGTANQELASEIITAVHNTYHGIYGYRGQWRRMFADAFMYGTMVGTQRPVFGDNLTWDGIGYPKDITVPALSHMPVRKVYLDATPYSAQRLGTIQAPGQIYEYPQRLPDMKLAANTLPRDPHHLMGGWLPEEIRDVDAGGTSQDRDNKDIDVLEYEGDLVFTRDGGEEIYIPHVIITTVKGHVRGRTSGTSMRVVRVRYPDMPYPSYVAQAYFVDSAYEGIYGTSPLMMGRPIQKMASESFNRLGAVVILNAEPIVRYDQSDPYMAQTGGPIIAPRAVWASISGVDVVEIGDPVALGGVVAQLRAEYQDVTGTTAPRLGQQTKSHQTAFAVDTEMVRGLSRTVSFGQLVTRELMPRQLQLELWQMRRHLPSSGMDVFLPKTKAWVKVKKSMLAEEASYVVAGAADPQMEQQKAQAKMVALQQVGAIEQMRVQMGEEPQVNWTELQREILQEGGFRDVERILLTEQPLELGGGELLGDNPAGPPVAANGAGVPTEAALRLAAGQGPPIPGE